MNAKFKPGNKVIILPNIQKIRNELLGSDFYDLTRFIGKVFIFTEYEYTGQLTYKLCRLKCIDTPISIYENIAEYLIPVDAIKLVDFNKDFYLKAIHTILKVARKTGVHYCRVYNEPRKSTGYRTKLYICSPKYKTRIQKIADDLYPDMFIVNAYSTTTTSNIWVTDNIEIIPTNIFHFLM